MMLIKVNLFARNVIVLDSYNHANCRGTNEFNEVLSFK